MAWPSSPACGGTTTGQPVFLGGSKTGVAFRLGALAALWLALSGACSRAAGAGGMPPFRADLLLSPPAGALLRAAVWVNQGYLHPGDPLQVDFFVDQAAYVALLGFSPDGRVRLLLPNGLDGRSHVGAGSHRVPRPHYRLLLTGPQGAYYLQLLVALRPLPIPWPPPGAPPQPVPVVSEDGPALREQLARALRPDRLDWTVAWTSFWVAAAGRSSLDDTQ